MDTEGGAALPLWRRCVGIGGSSTAPHCRGPGGFLDAVMTECRSSRARGNARVPAYVAGSGGGLRLWDARAVAPG
jgi:hypothetical protein